MSAQREAVAHPQWSELLLEAVTKPGSIEEAFSRFYGYSLGNRFAAMWQCHARGIPTGPIATFPRWIELGRHVKKGEHAIVLCQPITVKVKSSSDAAAAELAADTPADGAAVRTMFTWKPKWFVLAQTEGAELEADAFNAPTWHRDVAMQALELEERAFDMPDGNVLGYASGRGIAINPLAPSPLAVFFHEAGHVMLGHTAKDEALSDSEQLPRNIREVEAESVALLCLESLRLPGAEFCRGYIQNWYKSGEPIPEHNAQRIFKAADSILRAGMPAEAVAS